ncbi:partner and localizer of BRCA2 isoform X2 [Neoarius graeffei]|uniref:partner and localizer of BRCA2 isoform X2 n=1 Tax=Neoarius graeffei TaxID=443677 RepID=UPI00298C6C28|nr:partner and localizer of BRCA2 isoform X2 [Neoarius graeffei]
MSEENLTSQDKEELKRRLVLLQKEYERTAQRLQRAERREAVRKHVQNTISEQNQLLHINVPSVLEQSSSSSPEQFSNQNVPSDTTKVRFHLPDASPFSTLTCKRSPSRTHRLRSKRSRLRLQIRERLSDTEESQEKTEERWREERGETESEREWTGEEKDVERGWTEEEKTELLKGGLQKNEDSLTPVNLQSASKSSSVSQSPLTKLLGVNDPPADQSALRNSPSTSYHSKSSDHSNSSNETSSQSCAETVNDAEKSPGSVGFLTSCTLIEGLPFPVEYYVRTTRRMASAHRSVDLNAVIQSQLSNGRGRRRSSRGHVTSQPSSEKPPGKSRCKKTGPRGHRRAAESYSSVQSESLLQSPSSLPEPIPSPKLPSGPAPDSQLHLRCELSPDSEVYPVCRKKRRRAGVSRSQIPARIHDSSHLLLSLTSLTQALRAKDFRILSGLLTVFDVQDFHLPDDEFGQLKLERLCSSSSNAGLFAYNACFRKIGSISAGGQVENEKVVLDPSPHCASSKSRLPLAFTEAENADQSERELTSQALDKTQEDLLQSSITNQAEGHLNRGGEKPTQQIKPNDPHTLSANRRLMLDLSMSLTSHTQNDHNPPLISLGHTPNPSSELTPSLSSPDQDVASKQSDVEVNNRTPEKANEEIANVSVSSKVHIQSRDASEHTYSRSYSSHVSKMEAEPANKVLINAEVERQGCDASGEKSPMLGNISTRGKTAEIPKLTNEVLICSETESQHHATCALSQNQCPYSQTGLPLSQNNLALSPNGHLKEPVLKTKTPDTDDLYTISELHFSSQTPTTKTSPCEDIDNVLHNETSALPVASANQSEESDVTLSLNLVKTSQTRTQDSQKQHVELLSCGSLQKTHTLKALDGGCVLDVCLVRWQSDDWCVCVAGEWSVCVWKQKAGAQQWNLLYTWTFTQSVISLQGIPDSSALLCVCLGRLEITEARILYCPSTDSEFSQAELYKGALQAVLAVSDHRVTCCSAPGPQQNIQDHRNCAPGLHLSDHSDPGGGGEGKRRSDWLDRTQESPHMEHEIRPAASDDSPGGECFHGNLSERILLQGCAVCVTAARECVPRRNQFHTFHSDRHKSTHRKIFHSEHHHHPISSHREVDRR